MEEQFRQEVYQSLADIFGTMFFISVEEASSPLGEFSKEGACFIEGMVEISGNGVTDIKFYFPEVLAKNVAANFMGIDVDKVDDEMVLDASREATNMVVGGILSRVDPDGRCRLGIPGARKKEEFVPARELAGLSPSLYATDHGVMFLCCGEFSVCRPPV